MQSRGRLWEGPGLACGRSLDYRCWEEPGSGCGRGLDQRVSEVWIRVWAEPGLHRRKSLGQDVGGACSGYVRSLGQGLGAGAGIWEEPEWGVGGVRLWVGVVSGVWIRDVEGPG